MGYMRANREGGKPSGTLIGEWLKVCRLINDEVPVVLIELVVLHNQGGLWLVGH